MAKFRVVKIAMHVLATASLGISIFVAVMWARGGWHDQTFHQLGRWEFLSDGRVSDAWIQLIFMHDWNQPVMGPPVPAGGPSYEAWLHQFPDWRIDSGRFGLHYWAEVGTNQQNFTAAYGSRLDVDLPFWGAAVAGLVLPLMVWTILPLRRRGSVAGQWAATVAPEEQISAGPIDDDLKCVHCGYNLRTQSTQGRCPECGETIGDSLIANRSLAKSPAAWLRRVSAGHAALLLSRICMAATYATVFQRNGGFVREYVPPLICGVMTLLLYLLGIVLATTREFAMQHGTGQKISLRQLAVASVLLLGGGVAWEAVETMMTPKPFGLMGLPQVSWYWPPVILALLGWILFCGSVWMEFMFHAQIARRVPDRILARSCLIAGSVAAVSGLFMLYAADGILQRGRELGLLWGVVGIWFVCLAWMGCLNFDFAMRLWKAARYRSRKGMEQAAPAQQERQ